MTEISDNKNEESSAKMPTGRSKQPKVLLIGASGNFGKRLVRLLAVERGIHLILAGRNQPKLEQIALELGISQTMSVDRNRLDHHQLQNLAIDIVIDAAGPFDKSNARVIEAAIAANAHYVDLADNREFVANIEHFNELAKQAGVAIISGASSTPALSDAAVRKMTAGWKNIDNVRTSISPSNRQPRGLAVVKSILMNVGQPLSVFSGGCWTTKMGWGRIERSNFPGVGRRWISPIATPDQDLMVKNHRPRLSAEFYASLELSIMHLGLWLLHFLVRWKIMKSLTPIANLLKWLSDWFEPIGNDMGGMTVKVDGVNKQGEAESTTWWLAAKGDIGPNVPVLAALNCVRGIRDRRFDWYGARSCTGFLHLRDFEPDFENLGMETGMQISTKPTGNLFQIALGANYANLPEATQSIHDIISVNVWTGEGDVDGGNNFFSRLIGRVFGFPKPIQNAPVKVVIERDIDGTENWSRIWPTNIMKSRMRNADSGERTVEEWFGPIAFTLKLDGHSDGLDMHLKGARIAGIPLPRFLLPNIAATERADGDKHLFDVDVGLPIIGRLVRYRGWLKANDNA